MRKKLLYSGIFLTILGIGAFLAYQNFNAQSEIEQLREQHQTALDNSPFKTSKTLSKEERKQLALPPNAYNEEIWELTMDPALGRPTPERLAMVQKSLNEERQATRGVGGDTNNPWIDRGPNNIGGRTRAIMFDPNDVTNQRVYAGGVSGGLWVNANITDPNTSWVLVPGINANISVNVMISDPNNSNIFYIGSGESYTSGAAVGRGIWRSTDGGVTWSNVFGGYTSTSTPGAGGVDQLVNGVFYVNDLVARDNGGNTELFAAIAGAFYGDAGTNPQWNGLNEQGLYKSTNGTTWNKITLNESNGSPINPNDLEIDINNNVWLATTSSSWGFDGGRIFRSTDGTNFSQIFDFGTLDGNGTAAPNFARTEIEPSATNANTFWAAVNFGGQADLYTTTNAFTSVTQITTEPNSADPGIPASDYTRGQAFYDLPIESDASGNLMVGGIDLFRSTDNGATWPQISEWYNQSITASFVHADQHAIVQRPGTVNEYVFGTDGGVYYTPDISTAAGSSTAITARNKDYNTVQFYYGDITSVVNTALDDIVGGTQDNGTPAIIDAAAGANPYTDVTGGDGGYTEWDDSGSYFVTAYPRNNHYVFIFGSPNQFYSITSGGGSSSAGSFINQGALDKNLDILYSNSSTGTFSIERTSGFLGGPGTSTNATLQNALLNGSPSAMKVSPFTTTSTKLFVGLNNGRLLRVDNANVSPTWTNITGPSFLGSISDIEFGQNESEIFVTMFNYGVTSIWFSNDGGSTWSSKEGNFPDIPVRCILQNPLIPQELIIGTDLGVWATADYTQASPNWIQTYNGMSDVTVVDLDVRTSDDVILASTHGRGFFTSQFTSTTLSVESVEFNDTSVQIFPTVSNGEFSLIGKRALGNITMNIYDLNGKSVYSSKFQMNIHRKEFDLDLSPGMYLVRIESDNSFVTKRLIIQ